jgi:hypothetical protein
MEKGVARMKSGYVIHPSGMKKLYELKFELRDGWGNLVSVHSTGVRAKDVVEAENNARRQLCLNQRYRLCSAHSEGVSALTALARK